MHEPRVEGGDIGRSLLYHRECTHRVVLYFRKNTRSFDASRTPRAIYGCEQWTVRARNTRAAVLYTLEESRLWVPPVPACWISDSAAGRTDRRGPLIRSLRVAGLLTKTPRWPTVCDCDMCLIRKVAGTIYASLETDFFVSKATSSSLSYAEQVPDVVPQ